MMYNDVMTPNDCRKKYGFYPDDSKVKNGIVVCLNCEQNPAPYWDWGPGRCDDCVKASRQRYAESGGLGGYPEFVPQKIHEERRKYLKSQIQSHRGGEFSKEFADNYPEKTKDMVKNGVITEKQVKNARPVWGDLPGISHVDKTL